eukprot:TRINITY_DN14042_c0_g1_i1.p2 TRINITY_DN14042_c0_g1~~TRINITY_DN14042_c0_g1_i1.p2  ORF type:complete len:110 (+),score=12.13 TRINITY_DN14042_c0_g1_i1:121-450(+)
MDLDGRYVSLLDSLSSYCFTPLEELQDWAKDLSVARPVRVIGKFCETNDGVMLAQDNVQVQCNFKQMRHKFLMNFSEYFECLGEYVLLCGEEIEWRCVVSAHSHDSSRR